MLVSDHIILFIAEPNPTVLFIFKLKTTKFKPLVDNVFTQLFKHLVTRTTKMKLIIVNNKY